MANYIVLVKNYITNAFEMIEVDTDENEPEQALFTALSSLSYIDAETSRINKVSGFLINEVDLAFVIEHD